MTDTLISPELLDVEQGGHRFGPQGVHIDALIELGRTFDTTEFFGPLPKRTDSYAVLMHKWAVRDISIRSSGREPAQTKMLELMRYRSAEGVSQVGAPCVWWWTANALLIRDLITDTCFTQDFYDELTRDWRIKVGPIHPDDAPLKG